MASNVVVLCRFDQSSGRFSAPLGQGGADVHCVGYSGYMGASNDETFEAVRGKGPIPRGLWSVGVPYHHTRLGPLSFPLAPKGHSAFGRTAFFIHGDNRRGDRSGSHGCIILPRVMRAALARVSLSGRRIAVLVE